jgi:hypothetical protein
MWSKLALLAHVAAARSTHSSSPTPDLEFQPRPYVVASRFGGTFFQMSPDPADPEDRDKGFGYAFKACVSGRQLASYSTAELIEDHDKVPVTSSHYSFLGAPEPGFATQPNLFSDELLFRLTTSDGTRCTFDARTGAKVGVEKP